MPVENWVNAGTKRIFYRQEGKGIPVLLLHGFAEDGTIWNNQVEYLKQNARLIVPDLPGSGLSDANEDLLTIDDYADVVKIILDKENISSCIIIGHSMGGYIALAFAEKYANRLIAFGLFHSTAYADSEEKKATRRKSIEFIKKYGAAEFIRQSTPNLFSNYTKENKPDIIGEIINKYDNFNPSSLVSYYEAMILRPDRTSVLQNFQKPILFIIGEEDSAVPLEQSLKQCYMPAVSHIRILGRTGHMGMMESKNEANTSLLSFVKTNVI